MIDVLAGVRLSWDVTQEAIGDEAGSISVVLGRATQGGDFQPLGASGLPLKAEYVDSGSTSGSYALRLVASIGGEAPNESQWSDSVFCAQMVFGGLSVPGESERQRLAQSILARYLRG